MPSALTASDLSPSLSDTEDCPQLAPELLHNLRHDSSVLCLAVCHRTETIFAGTQDGEIVVWSLSTFQQVRKIQAHKRSVLCLFLSEDGSMLLSSAGDPIVNVWCPKSLNRLYEIYSTYDVGDIFSVAYSAQHDTVYLGAQNTSIQWVNLKDPKNRVSHDSAQHPDRRNHRFFDSRAVGGGASTPRRNDERWATMPKSEKVVEIPAGAVQMFAHYGYIYCMLMAKGPTMLVEPDEEVLISGGGDGTIKLWKLSHRDSDDEETSDDPEPGLQELMVLGSDDAESVMSLAIDGSFLYAGKLSGVIELWDLDTRSRLRVIKSHKGDVMTLQMGWGFLWSASGTGTASKHSTVHYGEYQDAQAETVSQKYQCLARWKAHEGKILASVATTYNSKQYFITGANDNEVAIWRIDGSSSSGPDTVVETEDVMLTALQEFVSYKTVSSRPEFAEDCHRGATFLGSLFKRLGAQVDLLSTDSSPHNPAVLAKFSGTLPPSEKRKRILFYGHYDVVTADPKKSKWATDPFQLKGINGYLYGRGVSDNKGPIMAALFAVTDLLQAKKLDNDIVFLIEGEEEAASRGFKEIVRRNKNLIGDVDYILLANSYWLDDEVPCLTYGLRGVLHATICVESPLPDLHSGVDGSHMNDEPLSDLTSTLSKLKGAGNKVMIPGFYDSILQITPEEETRYDEIASLLMKRNPERGPIEKLRRALMARWREPNLTIHRYKVSGPDGSLVSSHASANISLRLVPGQEVEQVIESLTSFLQSQFDELGSENSLSVQIDNQAEPWLGNPNNAIFRTLEEAIIKAWAPVFAQPTDSDSEDSSDTDDDNASERESRPRRPLYIREGGSIPAIRFLEKEFKAPAAHLPCGQSSDSAHLDNERLRVVNLVKSREIFGHVFSQL
ncbi:WD repeat-containing protein [Plectosphaerella cucumerina]|uniref:WD repeat-containing protein n=1 Tax=Plectosphaerella cucumerina TaxID=40658 RepID=A0A8K0T9P7_9PEZI|nr:WD repeat-containing protein [Plectosphaerella cucumerina]